MCKKSSIFLVSGIPIFLIHYPKNIVWKINVIINNKYETYNWQSWFQVLWELF